MTQRLSRLWMLVLVASMLVVPALVELYTDWLWFGETGYRQVFLRSLGTKSAIAGAVFALVFGFFYVNARGVLRALRRQQFTIPTSEGPLSIEAEPASLRRVVYAVAGLGALALAAYAASRWEAGLLYWYATPFGSSDPILGRDAGFYVFRLPFLTVVQGLLQITLVMTLAIVGAGYFVSGGLGVGAVGGPFASRAALHHLSTLAAGLLAVLAFGVYLAIPATLTEASGIVHGASNADVEARLPALRLLLVAALAGCVLALYQTVSRKLWPIGAAVGLYLAVSLGGDGLRRSRPALRRRPERAGQGDAVHPPQHRGHARGVRAGRRRGAGAVRATRR